MRVILEIPDSEWALAQVAVHLVIQANAAAGMQNVLGPVLEHKLDRNATYIKGLQEYTRSTCANGVRILQKSTGIESGTPPWNFTRQTSGCRPKSS